jgi:hypothetical protein
MDAKHGCRCLGQLVARLYVALVAKVIDTSITKDNNGVITRQIVHFAEPDHRPEIAMSISGNVKQLLSLSVCIHACIFCGLPADADYQPCPRY